jgi:hypothetical protein
MRLDLGVPIEKLRADAIGNVTMLARLAHEEHENLGGYGMAHALDVYEVEGHPGAPAAANSLDRHRAIQESRRQAIVAIRGAPHGAAIAEIVRKFTQETTS